MKVIKFVLVFVFCAVQSACASKILVVFPLPGRSHSILGSGVVRHLLEDNHEVTYVTPFPIKDPPKNLRQIDVSANFDVFPTHMTNIEAILNKTVDFGDLKFFFSSLTNLMTHTIKNENFKPILRDPKEQFDVVIVEYMFSNLLSGLGAVFQTPFIWVSTVEPHNYILSLIDENPNPAYVTDVLSKNTLPLNFWQRWQELGLQMVGSVLRMIYLDGIENEEYDKSFREIATYRGINNLPPFYDVKYNASLVLGNSHVSLGEATKLPLSYKAVGGYHIETDVKPLPEDLKKIMDSAKHGVIYFSMGSNLKSKDFPDAIKRDIVKMLGELKQTVLWKFEEVLPELPKNLHILKWAPQSSILSHPNCVLFITHGGLLSTTETIHFGVPIIGIPVFADQFVNVGRAVRKGFALKVDLSYEMAAEMKEAIIEITTNPKYAEKTKELSQIYHDRPVLPGKELVHWVNHVIKTRGAAHLRSPAAMVPWYFKLYLDLLAVVLLVVITIYYTIKKLISKCRSSKNTNAKNVKNKTQ